MDAVLPITENAWKPARFISSANMSDDEKETQELYKKVRGVLNKLTPQKFDTLLKQVKSLTIDTKERLQGVTDLVFEKAVVEPNFSKAYALMCRKLALTQVPSCNSSGSKKDKFVNFRKLLVTRCQLEFEKKSVDETARNCKMKEIQECTDPEKKKELQLLLEDDDRRIRRKSVGNIRFIGELFKQQMLTVNIMMRCSTHLLDNKDEESLECLCELLSTVGKDVEERNNDLTPIFTVIREIVDKKHGKISSRVRFMLQDVIDLRNSKWIPRRRDLNPKIINQI